MTYDIANKIILITGANRGIGKALVEFFVEHGAAKVYAAGMAEISEPPILVAEGIIAALQAGEFHVFPDSRAKQIGDAYESFAKSVVEVNMAEG